MTSTATDELGRQSPDGIDLDALQTFLAEAVAGGLAGPLQGRLLTGGRSNPTYELNDGSSFWVLRRPPLGEILQSAHDMSRESRVIEAMATSQVPVATVVASCADDSIIGAPFYVMDKIEGFTLRTAKDTGNLTPAQRAGLADNMVRVLADLHEVDPDDVGLSTFGKPVGYLERQLKRWVRQWDTIKTREAPQLAELAARLEATMPELKYPGIVHGDYKIDNFMLDNADPTNILALLDWEMATLGDTLADVGQMVSFWDEPNGLHNPITAGATAHPGFPSAAEVVEKYATLRGIDVSAINWYVVFADFKLAVILEQIHARHLGGHTVGEGFESIGPMVVPILERALQRPIH